MKSAKSTDLHRGSADVPHEWMAPGRHRRIDALVLGDRTEALNRRRVAGRRIRPSDAWLERAGSDPRYGPAPTAGLGRERNGRFPLLKIDCGPQTAAGFVPFSAQRQFRSANLGHARLNRKLRIKGSWSSGGVTNQVSIMSWTLFARASIAKGFVIICIPGSRWPFPTTAFSA